MFRKTFLTFIIFIAVCFVFVPVVSFAAEPNPQHLDNFIEIGDGIYGEDNVINEDSLIFNVGTMIRILLGTLGIALTIIIVYAGYLWLTAGGTEAQVTKARAWITNGIIGLVITLSAFAITEYVIARLGGV
ncbi:hypothetical protein HN958_03725 [Candidatus Falkowbacteria bacterium]|jgi:hypothetical protein|nr:hypothetical protein [Candidatus Falkowbacteria bacterium]MBT7007587.1 hypothetical protein [Candidatus Falkowbacteria bacterium]